MNNALKKLFFAVLMASCSIVAAHAESGASEAYCQNHVYDPACSSSEAYCQNHQYDPSCSSSNAYCQNHQYDPTCSSQR